MSTHPDEPLTASNLSQTESTPAQTIATVSNSFVCITELKGVTSEIAAALHAVGIDNCTQLLAASGRPEGRAEVAAALGIDAETMLALVNRADLARIHGLTRAHVDL